MPNRIQLHRTRGWRLPAGAVVVTREEAVAEYEAQLREGRLNVSVNDVRRELAGHDLACWCHLDEVCHADLLLRIANGAP